jgi:hypothetical protein
VVEKQSKLGGIALDLDQVSNRIEGRVGRHSVTQVGRAFQDVRPAVQFAARNLKLRY